MGLNLEKPVVDPPAVHLDNQPSPFTAEACHIKSGSGIKMANLFLEAESKDREMVVEVYAARGASTCHLTGGHTKV